MESISQTLNDLQFEDVELEKYDTLKFFDLKPGKYLVMPKRRIHTKFGNQWIMEMQAEDGKISEHFIPSSYIKKLMKMFNDPCYTHALNFISYTKDSRGRYDYKFQIARKADSKKVDIEIPICEQKF